ncbi:MAG: thioesterase II family protein [Myxococcota bacterium]
MRGQSHPRVRLICLAHAGGMAAPYAAWNRTLPAWIRAEPLELPGRGRRFKESTVVEPERLVELLARDVIRLGAEPFALFGHSLGAVLAFEIARELMAHRQPSPELLIVSGRNAPSISEGREPIHELPDEQFIQALTAYQEATAHDLSEPQLRDVFLPLLRADFTLLARYRFRDSQPLACPIRAFIGTSDPNVDSNAVAPWRSLTSASFALRTFTGGHFYLRDAAPVIAAVETELSDHFGVKPHTLKLP